MVEKVEDGTPAFPTAVHTGLTILQYAAIHLRVEHPGLPPWLNEMIRNARRDEFTKAALAGRYDACHPFKMIDAMLAAGDVK